ncbi:MAG: methyltransferase [Alphaproteobacteria bacterium]|nr:methyltransferase [Alphaproteobacteria bacterium]
MTRLENLPPHDGFHLLHGRVRIRQGSEGLRAGTDAVLLGATPFRAKSVLELGCGVGQALLCYGTREKAATLTGIEVQADNIILARANAEDNAMSNRMRIVAGDFSHRQEMQALGVGSDSFDLVLLNPPFYRRNTHTAPVDPQRQHTHIEDTPLAEWLSHALRYTRQFGWLALIHCPGRSAEILEGLNPKAGNIHLLPIYSRVGQNAKRVMVFAQKSRRAPCVLLPGLVMHDAEGYSDAARRILEDAEDLGVTLDRK